MGKISLLTRPVRKLCVTKAKAAFTAASLTGPVASRIREADAPPYAKVGAFFEVRDDDFSDADGTATRVTGSLIFYSDERADVEALADEYLQAITTSRPTIDDGLVYLYKDPSVIFAEEADTGGASLWSAIVDHTFTVEPT